MLTLGKPTTVLWGSQRIPWSETTWGALMEKNQRAEWIASTNHWACVSNPSSGSASRLRAALIPRWVEGCHLHCIQTKVQLWVKPCCCCFKPLSPLVGGISPLQHHFHTIMSIPHCGSCLYSLIMMVYLLYMKQGISSPIFLTFLLKKGSQYTITLVM